jgi:hypothetical protein
MPARKTEKLAKPAPKAAVKKAPPKKKAPPEEEPAAEDPSTGEESEGLTDSEDDEGDL